MARMFSYVVEHDEGRSPHPRGRYCSLVHCKFSQTGIRPNVVEAARVGDWIVGTGGANLRKSAGHGKIIYAMKVTKKFSLSEYLCSRMFAARADHHTGPDAKRRFALISDDFYYFGRNAPRIPPRFNRPHPLEKKGPGYRSDFDAGFIVRFERWLRNQFSGGINGSPCKPPSPNTGPQLRHGCSTRCIPNRRCC
jgi:hypothetical protein